MRIVVIDNYDSFTWNLVDVLECNGASCEVVRSDEVDLAALRREPPDRLVISPGPLGPDQAGRSIDALAALPPRVPILGVCLGMQVIARAAGALVRPSGRPVHGKSREIVHDGKGVFAGVPSPTAVGLYHSLIVVPETLSDDVEVSARCSDIVMGIRLRARSTEGVLFHPESFLSGQGPRILTNFLEDPYVVE